MTIQVKFLKLSPDAVSPSYAKLGDAGMDLTAISKKYVAEIDELKNESKSYIEYGTGLAFEIPEGYVGLIFPRSSLSNKSLMLTNHVGVIDSGYRGEICFRFKRTIEGSGEYEVGDRIGQLIIMPYPSVELKQVKALTRTVRGIAGFGSSGK